MNDLISIIIPVYNAGKTIDSCIESVLKSTYSDFEILIIDDGSNAETADECDKVALKDQRVKVIHQENGGVSKARNCGIENATGKFITFVDADDTVDSDLLACMMSAMQREQADVVITGHREFVFLGVRPIFVFCRGKIGSLLRLLRAPLNIPCPLRFQTGC